MADEDPAYLRWVRSLPCLSCGRDAPSHPHHDTHQRGAGQRSHDRRAVPLCWVCHRLFHDGAGRFRDLGREARVTLQEGWVLATQAHWEALHDGAVF